MRIRSLLTAGLTAALVLSFMPSGAAAEGTHSPNVTHVLNHPHRVRALDGALGGGGTDIEFASLSVAVRDAAGNPICFDRRGRPAKPGRPCAFQYEGRELALAGSYDNGLQIVDVT